MLKSRIPSPARSQGAITPRRHKSRASRSLCSPAHSTASGRLTSVIDQFKEKNLEFELTPVTTRRSVLTDNTDIEEPRRKSWWKNLNENSRDVMEVLNDKATEAVNAIEDIADIEILSQENKNYTLDLPESSDNESINSIVLPQRKLFTLKENKPQKKFGELVGTRDTLAKLHKTQNDKTINAGTKDLFQRNKRSRPVFPAALLNISPNKTAADKTKEIVAAEAKVPVRNIFGSRPANKRKNIFADFIVSESEDEISEIQPKVFGFQKKNQQTSSVGKGREHSPASSITTDMELDEWKLLPSSTMVEHQLDEMVAVTPVKRARLSKLSEAKESEAGTNYTTIDKTKQSNNSSPPVKRTRLSKQLEAESEQGTITTADKRNKETEEETNISTSINKTKQSKKSLPSSPVMQSNLIQKLNNTELDLVEKAKQSNKSSPTPVTRARLSKQLDDKESQKETNISTTTDKNKQLNKTLPSTPVTRARLSKQSDYKESEKETNISPTTNKIKQPNKSLSPTPVTRNRLSKQLHDKESDKEANISTTTDKNEKLNKTSPSTPATRARLSKQLHDKESEKETNISTTTDKIKQPNKSLPPSPVTRNRLSKQLDDKEFEAENNISMTVDKSKLTNKSFSTTPVTRASLSKQLNNEKLEAEINVSTSVNKSKPSKKSISPPEITQARLSKHEETQANIANQPNDLSKSMKSKTSPRNKSNVSNIGDKTVPENENVNNEDYDEQNLTLEYEEDEQIVDEGIDQNAQNKSYNNDIVINKTTIENKEIKEIRPKQNQSKTPSVKEVKDNNKNEAQAEIVNDNTKKVDQEKEDTTNEIGESKEIEASKNDNQRMSGTQQDNERDKSEEKDNVTQQEIVNESHVEDVEENVNEEDEKTQEDEEANNSDEVDEDNGSEQEDEVNESQENESEDESVNQSAEVENDDDEEVNDEDNDEDNDESEEEEQTNNTSQEIEEKVANESQASENEGDDEEDEVNESREVENDNLSEEDQNMDDSADDRAIASDAMSEEEQEEMEVDEESEESNKENAIYSEEVIEESPNVTHDTTGRNRKKIKSPEVILHDKTKILDSFIAKGRNTSIRNTKSIYKDLNIRPSLAPARDSLALSDGTRDSSAEGSGWDSHRTTRKTLRQTFGKDFTPRKSLRALVMEKAAKQTEHMETLNNDTAKPPQANSTELPEYSNREDNVTIESDHELSRRTRQTTLETYLQKIKQNNIEKKIKMEEAIRNSLKVPPARDPLNLFKVPAKPVRKPRTSSIKTKKAIPNIFQGELPPEVIEDMKYKPPKRFQPTKASWITKRLYKHLENKLEPKYDYKARVRAEKLMETIFFFVKELRRHDVASPDAVEMLKHEMARLDIVKTHFEFYEFFHEFMPREVRVKVIPDIVNNIALPRRGVFSDIIRENTVQG